MRAAGYPLGVLRARAGLTAGLAHPRGCYAFASVAALGAVAVTAVGAASGRVAAGRDGVWGWLVRRGVPVTV
jgi:hypothetical protein